MGSYSADSKNPLGKPSYGISASAVCRETTRREGEMATLRGLADPMSPPKAEASEELTRLRGGRLWVAAAGASA